MLEQDCSLGVRRGKLAGMISTRDLVRHLSHGDGLVRDHALHCLALGGEHSGVDACAALDAIASSGENAFSEPLRIRDLPMLAETFTRVCDAQDGNPLSAIARWLADAPQELITAQSGRVESINDAGLRDTLRARLKLNDQPPEELWAQLSGAADAKIMLALVQHDGFLTHQLAAVRPGDARERVMIELAGRAHLGGAVHMLLDRLGSADEELGTAAVCALSRIGTAGVVTEIEHRCDREPVLFRRRAARCLARIRVPSVEPVLQRLAVQEDDPNVSRELSRALVDICTTQAFDRIAVYAKESGDAEIRKGALAVSIMLGRTIAESASWRGERRMCDIEFARAFAGRAIEVGGTQGDAAPRQAIVGPKPIHAEAKVGRNDPCPCGSGKKYKKCCGA